MVNLSSFAFLAFWTINQHLFNPYLSSCPFSLLLGHGWSGIYPASSQVIAESLSEEEIAGLKEMFQAMDTDNSGAITFDELKAGLKTYGSTLKESEIRALMDAVRSV